MKTFIVTSIAEYVNPTLPCAAVFRVYMKEIGVKHPKNGNVIPGQREIVLHNLPIIERDNFSLPITETERRNGSVFKVGKAFTLTGTDELPLSPFSDETPDAPKESGKRKLSPEHLAKMQAARNARRK